MSYPTGIEVDEAFAYLDDIARGHASVPNPCHKLLGAALVLRSEVVTLRKQLEEPEALAAALREQRDAEETEAMESGGILSDVCDIAFADPQRAMKEGYAGIRERVAVLANLPDPEEWPFCCTTCGQGLGVGDVDVHSCRPLPGVPKPDGDVLVVSEGMRKRIHDRVFGEGS